MLNEKKNQITIYKNSINLLNFQHSRVHKGAVIIFLSLNVFMQIFEVFI